MVLLLLFTISEQTVLLANGISVFFFFAAVAIVNVVYLEIWQIRFINMDPAGIKKRK